MDLCIVLDSSDSIREQNPADGSYDNWQLVLNFVKQVRLGQTISRLVAGSPHAFWWERVFYSYFPATSFEKKQNQIEFFRIV